MKETASRWLRRHATATGAFALFLAMYAVYLARLGRGLDVGVLTTSSNKAVLLALIAMAQALPMITRGIDLSVGAVVVLSSCIASALVDGDAASVSLGVAASVAAGAACGLCNGLAIVALRLQPIIVTLATSAIVSGLSLLVRPTPGGEVSEGLSDALTYALGDAVPTTLVLLFGVVGLIWIPFARSRIGLESYAVGSSESAARMSGARVGRAKIASYALSGVLAGIAGLLFALISQSAEASGAQAASFTLNAIAAAVIGGVSLAGGVGSAVGAAVGAFVLRTIGDLLFAFDAPPLLQPLFEGLVLLAAVGASAAAALKVGNKLELFR